MGGWLGLGLGKVLEEERFYGGMVRVRVRVRESSGRGEVLWGDG